MNRLIIFLILSLVISCKEYNHSPECEITSPEDGAVFVIGDTVEIEVDVWDSDADIVVVEFGLVKYQKGIYYFYAFGGSQSYPYRFDWDTREYRAGVDTIRAVVYDYGGGKGSDEITIILKDSTIKSAN